MSTPFDAPATPFGPDIRFGPGIPVSAVLGATDTPSPRPPREAAADAVSAADRPPDEASVATASNRAGSITVTATDHGLPLEVRVDPRELRYGGPAVAAAILEVCEASTAEAGARRRDELSSAGVPADILDRLGLPRREDLSAAQARRESAAAPTTWMRPV